MTFIGLATYFLNIRIAASRWVSSKLFLVHLTVHESCRFSSKVWLSKDKPLLGQGQFSAIFILYCQQMINKHSLQASIFFVATLCFVFILFGTMYTKGPFGVTFYIQKQLLIKGNSNVNFQNKKCDTYSLFRFKCTVTFVIYFRLIYKWSLKQEGKSQYILGQNWQTKMNSKDFR